MGNLLGVVDSLLQLLVLLVLLLLSIRHPFLPFALPFCLFLLWRELCRWFDDCWLEAKLFLPRSGHGWWDVMGLRARSAVDRSG